MTNVRRKLRYYEYLKCKPRFREIGQRNKALRDCIIKISLMRSYDMASRVDYVITPEVVKLILTVLELILIGTGLGLGFTS